MTDRLLTTVLLVAVSFLYSTVGFAIVYYLYGIVSGPDASKVLISILLNESSSELFNQNEGMADLPSFPILVGEDEVFVTPFGDFSFVIATDPLDYLYFSLSKTLPGLPSSDLKGCDSARIFEILQSITNMAYGVITVFLAVRLTNIVAKDSNPKVGETIEKPRKSFYNLRIARLNNIRSRKPNVFNKDRFPRR